VISGFDPSVVESGFWVVAPAQQAGSTSAKIVARIRRNREQTKGFLANGGH
jgi:hypothetical protein